MEALDPAQGPDGIGRPPGPDLERARDEAGPAPEGESDHRPSGRAAGAMSRPRLVGRDVGRNEQDPVQAEPASDRRGGLEMTAVNRDRTFRRKRRSAPAASLRPFRRGRRPSAAPRASAMALTSRREALAFDRGDGEERESSSPRPASGPRPRRFLSSPRRSILLATRICAAPRDLGIEGLELLHDDFEIVDGIAARVRRDVEDVDEELRPLDVLQELDPQPVAEMGALDEAGDVGDDEAPRPARRRRRRGWG